VRAEGDVEWLPPRSFGEPGSIDDARLSIRDRPDVEVAVLVLGTPRVAARDDHRDGARLERAQPLGSLLD
jgi:hypothetical protein